MEARKETTSERRGKAGENLITGPTGRCDVASIPQRSPVLPSTYASPGMGGPLATRGGTGSTGVCETLVCHRVVLSPVCSFPTLSPKQGLCLHASVTRIGSDSSN